MPLKRQICWDVQYIKHLSPLGLQSGRVQIDSFIDGYLKSGGKHFMHIKENKINKAWFKQDSRVCRVQFRQVLLYKGRFLKKNMIFTNKMVK